MLGDNPGKVQSGRPSCDQGTSSRGLGTAERTVEGAGGGQRSNRKRVKLWADEISFKIGVGYISFNDEGLIGKIDEAS